MEYKLLNNIISEDKECFSKDEVKQIIEELSIYHTELEAQNNELIDKDKELLNINNEFVSLFKHAPIPFLLLNKELEIKKFNDEADYYFQFSSLTLPTRSIFMILKKHNIELFIKWINNKEYNIKNIELDMICSKQNINRFKVQAKPYSLKKDWLMLSLVDIQSEYEIQQNLENKVEEKTKETLAQHQLIQKQSKIASMGEMIDAIAHQWISPLSIIKLYAQDIEYQASIEKDIDKEKILSYAQGTLTQINHLTDTLSEFRSFFRPNKKIENIPIELLLKSLKVLIKDELAKNRIQMQLKGSLNLRVEVIPNEFKHVLINLFTNSRDAFNEKGIKGREIIIDVKEDNENALLIFSDNAGGIPDYIIDKIFEPDFTTKKEGLGTGVGLYLTKQILDKVEASISVENIKNGASFTIMFNT